MESNKIKSEVIQDLDTKLKQYRMWTVMLTLALVFTLVVMGFFRNALHTEKEASFKRIAELKAQISQEVDWRLEATTRLFDLTFEHEELQDSYDLAIAVLDEQNKTFKPEMTLSDAQNKLCLTILAYGEERMGGPEDVELIMQTIVNRAMDVRWGSNVCSVAKEGNGVQYESMKHYIGVIKDIAWNGANDYMPESTSKKSNLIAWNRISKIASDVIDGKTVWKTEANHFINLRGLDRIQTWIKSIRISGYTSGHVLLTDYEIRDGKKVIYTRAKPYNQAKYTAGSWKKEIKE